MTKNVNLLHSVRKMHSTYNDVQDRRNA